VINVSIVGPEPARREIREVLERAGFRIATEAETLDDLVQHTGDVLVMQAEPTSDGVEEALTARELEVLELLAEGLSNRSTAERLGISEHTVKFHISAIYGKLGASSRAQAIRRAARRGLITI
jgi:DNA-binding CsgD family transcriptional regulator